MIAPFYTGIVFYTNTDRLTGYLERSAPIHASDPADWRGRQLAGEAIKKRVRQGPRKSAAQVLSMVNHRSVK